MLILSIIFAVWLSRQPGFTDLLHSLGGLGYLGAFIAGALFVSTFTVSISVVIFSILNQHLSLPEICFFAALGAMAGDLIIFHIVKQDLEEEIKPIEKYVAGTHLWKLLHSRHFRWTLPVIGAFFMITPLPNELGLTLLRLARMPTPEFTLVSFALNTLGILSATTIIKILA